jgi:hypothetical protein
MSPAAGAPYRYAAPTELVHGPGSIARLGAEVKRLGGRRVLLVSDPGLAKAGLVERAADALRDAGLTFETDFNVPLDPTFEEVDRLVALVRAHDRRRSRQGRPAEPVRRRRDHREPRPLPRRARPVRAQPRARARVTD